MIFPQDYCNRPIHSRVSTADGTVLSIGTIALDPTGADVRFYPDNGDALSVVPPPTRIEIKGVGTFPIEEFVELRSEGEPAQFESMRVVLGPAISED